mgnify:CR=1 FL=1
MEAISVAMIYSALLEERADNVFLFHTPCNCTTCKNKQWNERNEYLLLNMLSRTLCNYTTCKINKKHDVEWEEPMFHFQYVLIPPCSLVDILVWILELVTQSISYEYHISWVLEVSYYSFECDPMVNAWSFHKSLEKINIGGSLILGDREYFS